jgi:colicin import membrane protein
MLINKNMKTETLEKSIVKINASDYGLEESKAHEIEAMFTPMLIKMKELEKEFNHILKLPINPETCQMAKDLRLSYVRVRTGTAAIHKDLKAFYLAGGRFVDAFKNTQEFASGEKESILKNIENHFEIIEAEKKAKLREERIALIHPYVEDVNTFMLGEMTEEAFKILFAGAKSQYEARIAAEKKAEEDRLAKEKADAEEREAQRLENIKLKADAEERERLTEIERKKQAEILAAQKAESDRKEKELLVKAEAEKKERERLENELKAKKEAEDKAKRAKDAADKKARLAPDKDKLLAFMQSINDLPRPDVKSIEIAMIAQNANTMLVQTAKYILDNTSKL